MALSRDELLLYGGAAVLVVGVVLMSRRSTSLALSGGGVELSPQAYRAQVDLARIFETGQTDQMRIQANERIALADVASRERIRGEELSSAEKISKIQGDTAIAISDTIAGTQRKAIDSQNNKNLLDTVLQFLPWFF